MKKLVCILLTLVMVMSLSVTAFAVYDYTDVQSLTEDNTRDITINQAINTGDGAFTAPKFYVGISWDVDAGATTVNRSAEYEWDPEALKYELRGENSAYVLSGDIATTSVTISVTNRSNADIGYAIAWTTDTQCDQTFGGIAEDKAGINGVCRENTRIFRADTEYMNYDAVDDRYNINPNAEGFDNFVGAPRFDTYNGTVTFRPTANLDLLYTMGLVTLGKYTVTIGDPPGVS